MAVVERARLSFEKHEPLPVVFLDIKKAFDRVWLDGLLYKLFVQFRVAGRCWKWIRAFLSGRRLRVRAKGFVSLWHSVPNGVPQGSVLAPLLFLVFINDLATTIDKAGGVPPLFADDAALMPKIGTRFALLHQVMQNSLDATYVWSEHWCVEWGMKKCALVVFHRSRSRPKNSDWLLSLGPNPLIRSDNCLYLGIMLQERLSWSLHFDQVVKRARFVCWKICRWIRQAEKSQAVSLVVVRQLVLSCVRSVFGYGLPVWRPNTAQVNSLQRCMLIPLRCCLHLSRTTSIPGILIECGIPHLRVWMEHLGMRLARRVVKLPIAHSARACWQHWRDGILDIDRVESARFFTSLPFAHLIFAIEAHWFGLDEASYFGVDDGVRTRQFFNSKDVKLDTPSLLLRCYTSAVVQGRCQHLLSIKHMPGLSSFYRTADHTLVVALSRIRLDRAKLNASLHQRKLSEDPYCDRPSCRRRLTHETPAHLLLECPRFKTGRAKLSQLLRTHGMDLSLTLLLGEWSKAVCKNDDVVTQLRRYILGIQHHRGF
jgi:hypothetical protein